MKILILTENYAPQVNGVVERLNRYIALFKEHGVHVDVHTITGAPDTVQLPYVPVNEWLRFDPPGHFPPSFGQPYSGPSHLKRICTSGYRLIWIVGPPNFFFVFVLPVLIRIWAVISFLFPGHSSRPRLIIRILRSLWRLRSILDLSLNVSRVSYLDI
jgi:hypothetical protein